MRPSLFWDVTLHGLIVIYRSFATTYRSHLQTWSLLHGTYRLSQKSVNSYQSTPSNTPEERRLRFFTYCCQYFFIISCPLVCSEDLPHSLLFRDFKHLGSLDHFLDDGLFRLVQCWVLTSTERLHLPRLYRPSGLQPTQKHIYPVMKQRSFKDTRALIGNGCQYDPSLARPRLTIWCYLVRKGGTILFTTVQSSRLEKRPVHIKVLRT